MVNSDGRTFAHNPVPDYPCFDLLVAVLTEDIEAPMNEEIMDGIYYGMIGAFFGFAGCVSLGHEWADGKII